MLKLTLQLSLKFWLFIHPLQALEESVQSKWSVRDSGYAEGWFSDREDQSDYRREDSVESLDSAESRTLNVASDCTLRAGSEGKTGVVCVCNGVMPFLLYLCSI